jgi:hypothetical protein
MKMACFTGPNSPRPDGQSADCPVFQWGGLTFWPYSYVDNRYSIGLVAYDFNGYLISQVELPGARYVYKITVDPSGMSVTIWGQSDKKVNFNHNPGHGTLTGYAVPCLGPLADHTYVRSGDTGWGCWGRDDGGNPICAGPGNYDHANAFSQTDSHAAIRYGLDGVCHQTANRILYPANVIVSAAHAYWASSWAYGTFGTHNLYAAIVWWKRKREVLGMSEPVPVPGYPYNAAMLSFVQQVQTLHASYAATGALNEQSTTPFTLHSQEFDLMLDHRLGHEKPLNAVADLHTAHNSFLTQKGELDTALGNRSLQPRDYANRVNQLVANGLATSATLLGRDLHVRLFGLEPGAQVQLIDPEIMAAQS